MFSQPDISSARKKVLYERKRAELTNTSKWSNLNKVNSKVKRPKGLVGVFGKLTNCKLNLEVEQFSQCRSELTESMETSLVW